MRVVEKFGRHETARRADAGVGRGSLKRVAVDDKDATGADREVVDGESGGEGSSRSCMTCQPVSSNRSRTAAAGSAITARDDGASSPWGAGSSSCDLICEVARSVMRYAFRLYIER